VHAIVIVLGLGVQDKRKYARAKELLEVNELITKAKKV
jgi:hypothetical protein